MAEQPSQMGAGAALRLGCASAIRPSRTTRVWSSRRATSGLMTVTPEMLKSARSGGVRGGGVSAEREGERGEEGEREQEAQASSSDT